MNVLKAPLTFLLLLCLAANAPGQSQHADSVTDAYERAEQMLSWNLSDKVYRSDVSPNWISNDMFWYSINTRRGNEYRVVDASNQTNSPAFNQERLALEIERISENTTD